MAEAAPSQGSGRTSADPELIEGGDVQPLEDYSFEEMRHRAVTARVLAYILVATLGITILLQYGLTVWLVLSNRESAIGSLDRLFNVLLPVLSGLVSGAVTFYFTKEKA